MNIEFERLIEEARKKFDIPKKIMFYSPFQNKDSLYFKIRERQNKEAMNEIKNKTYTIL